MDYFHNTHRWVLNNNTVEGFAGHSVGVVLTKNGQVTVNGGTFNNPGIDIFVSCASEHIVNEEGEGFGVGMLATDPTQAEVLIEGPISFQNPNNNIVMNAEIIFDEIPGKGFPMISGGKEDPLYFFSPQEVTLNFGPFQNSKAYFNKQDGNYIPITNTNRCAISEDDECVQTRYANKTNTRLKSEFNNSFLGSITPVQAVSHAMILGGKVTNIDTTTACANSGGDADNDGICASNDCNDSDPDIGAKQTPGTACDDGNPLNFNDVIQADSCTCVGTMSSSTFPAGTNILCLGDSRVEGDDAFESYRYEIWKDLLDCNWSF